MKALEKPIGLLGGTFDPIHNGHLRLAIQMRDRLGLASIRMIPSARPPHRSSPGATPGERAKWIRVAIAGEPGLRLDDRELIRPGPSYTVETLENLRGELPNTPLCLVMGSDVLAMLETWHRWQELLNYCHIVTVPRPGFEADMSDSLQSWLDEHQVAEAEALGQSLAGRVYHFDLPLLDISGTRVRDMIRRGVSPRYLLPEEVLRDIQELGTYREKHDKG